MSHNFRAENKKFSIKLFLTNIQTKCINIWNTLVLSELTQHHKEKIISYFGKTKKYTLSILLAFVIIIEAIIVFHKQSSVVTAVRTLNDAVQESVAAGASLSANLFPEGVAKYVKNNQTRKSAPTQPSIVKGASAIKSESKTDTTKSSASSKHATKVKTVDGVEKEIITVSDSIAGRDEDRKVILQQLADTIAKYKVQYGKFPLLYRNKSKGELGAEASDIIYLYNGDENKTNATAFTNGAYQFVRVEKCQNAITKSTEVSIVYAEEKLLSCQENANEYLAWIGN